MLVLVLVEARLCTVPDPVPKLARGVRSRRCRTRCYSLLGGEDDRRRKRSGNPGLEIDFVFDSGMVFGSAR